jgi:indole-3-glycerol phosphate synthase
VILEEIVQASSVRAQALDEQGEMRGNASEGGQMIPPGLIHKPMSLLDAVRVPCGRNAVIAEIKPASPSRGHLRTITNPASIAGELVRHGCSALSVITEPAFFFGSVATIPAIREMVPVPILRKDFIVDTRQLIETRQLGADAVLLIAAVLEDRLDEFVSVAQRQGLEPLVEVHTRKEVRHALDTSADLIGVNNRNLKTLKTNISQTIHLAPLITQAGRTVITESGVIWPCDIRTLRPYAQGYLIGSSIMAAKSPGKRLEGFVCA